MKRCAPRSFSAPRKGGTTTASTSNSGPPLHAPAGASLACFLTTAAPLPAAAFTSCVDLSRGMPSTSSWFGPPITSAASCITSCAPRSAVSIRTNRARNRRPPSPNARSSPTRVKAGIARARAGGKHLGRPRINGEIEQAIREALATGKGIRKVARECGVGTSVVQRIKAG
jgi:hypothetical protein